MSGDVFKHRSTGLTFPDIPEVISGLTQIAQTFITQLTGVDIAELIDDSTDSPRITGDLE